MSGCLWMPQIIVLQVLTEQTVFMLQGCWRRLKLQSKKEHDLHRRETRKTGGRKAPASPSEVSKLVADVLPAYVNPLEQEFDDDAGGELDLRRNKDERKAVITCEVDPSLLDHLEAIVKKGAEKVRKKEDNQKDEHQLKMKVLKLKEWKLIHQCDNMGIGLPPAYVNEEEDF
ncbi:hypothetical protein P5673_015357 [Acropora cervicornis]|uniref:Uncharacterized protein n=1 Tax=Acropora cervicornis TaxID=6130 RepID=A0AAD9QJA0_ACRCE|nr:hypothetical protein P5673_015357 [Acropora cervicornis]